MKPIPNVETRYLERAMDRRPKIVCDAEFRADADTGRISGYAALFDTETDLGGFREAIAPGAFTKTIAEKADIRALFNHNADYVLGRTSAGTLRVWEDDRGLRYEVEPQETAFGQDLVKQIKRGDITQSSFGFYIMKEEWQYSDNELPLRVIREAELFDVSPVTYPAYPQTTVGVRMTLEQALRAHGIDSDTIQAIMATAARRESGVDSADDERTTQGPEPGAGPASHSGGHQEPDAAKRAKEEAFRKFQENANNRRKESSANA